MMISAVLLRRPAFVHGRLARVSVLYQVSRSRSSNSGGSGGGGNVAPPPVVASLSRRQQFRQLPVDPKLLQYIREQQLCKPVRGKARSRKMDRLVAGRNGSNGASVGGGLPMRTRSRGGSRPRHQEHRQTTTTTTSGPQQPTQQQKPPLPFGPDAGPVRIRHVMEPNHDGNVILQGMQHLNPHKIPTVALCGRSNVGKSTLLNALLYGSRPVRGMEQTEPDAKGRRGGRRRTSFQRIPLPKGCKAAMSAKPGETRDIRFYELSAKNATTTTTTTRSDQSSPSSQQSTSSSPLHVPKLWLADLPGYGFAHASPDIVAAHRQLMATYLRHDDKRPQRVLLLLDARHGMKQTDRAFLQDLQNYQSHDSRADDGDRRRRRQPLPPLQIVLTKCDLVDATDLARHVGLVQDELDDILRRQTSRLPVLLTSATRQHGILAVQKELASLVRNNPK